MTETNEVPEHLHATRTDRGFEHMPPITDTNSTEVRVYEASTATGPHLWLRVGDGVAHLPAEDAWKLADQLRWLVEHHYQGDARPDESAELWAVHVQGPDDIVAAADRAAADRLASEINEAAEFVRNQSDARPDLLPHVLAVVVPWDGTAEQHAEALARLAEEGGYMP